MIDDKLIQIVQQFQIQILGEGALVLTMLVTEK